MSLGPILGQWHQWRRGWTPERGYARVPVLAGADHDPDEESDRLLFLMIDDELAKLSQLHQLAIQHVARAECLGVEVIHAPRLPKGAALDTLIADAMAALRARLLRAGLSF